MWLSKPSFLVGWHTVLLFARAWLLDFLDRSIFVSPLLLSISFPLGWGAYSRRALCLEAGVLCCWSVPARSWPPTPLPTPHAWLSAPQLLQPGGLGVLLPVSSLGTELWPCMKIWRLCWQCSALWAFAPWDPMSLGARSASTSLWGTASVAFSCLSCSVAWTLLLSTELRGLQSSPVCSFSQGSSPLSYVCLMVLQLLPAVLHRFYSACVAPFREGISITEGKLVTIRTGHYSWVFCF